MSPRTIHFWVLDKSPVSGPGKGPGATIAPPGKPQAWGQIIQTKMIQLSLPKIWLLGGVTKEQKTAGAELCWNQPRNN